MEGMMALTNYERQKRWREKNRVIYNLKRRNARKELSVVVAQRSASSPQVEGGSVPSESVTPLCPESAALNSPQTSKEETLAKLRELVKTEQEKPSTEARVRSDVVGGIYRNDSGGVISKFSWEKLQKMKEKAKEGGYTLDEYSQ